MCGICGIWGSSDTAQQRINAMVAAMYHRGPDDRGTFQDESVALGMTRLAIIDTSSAGHQPMSIENELIWIVYNGEIYNFLSERQILESKRYSFRSHSDTEVILRMYAHYGDDFLLRLRGIFALAIYDKRGGDGQERLLLARDHLGVKPLLYTQLEGALIFASELKALLASDKVPREIDPVALRMLLAYGSIYQPHTMLRDVQMLPPAHRLIAENGQIRIERYWSMGVDRCVGLRQRPYQELVAEVANKLEETVRLQMVSDVPLGAFLSGGVDSSFLVALMVGMVGDRLKTFSVGFGEEGTAIDETSDAQRTADFLGTNHTTLVVRGEEVRDSIRLIAAGLDQPSVDGVNSYFISEAARQRVTVAISGTGGDEIFAGYPWFINVARYHAGDGMPGGARRFAKRALGQIVQTPLFDQYILTRYAHRLQNARNHANFVSQYATNYAIFGPVGAAHLVSPDLAASAQIGRAPYYDLAANDELPDESPLERVSALCLRGYTGNQLLRDIDAVSMAHSLEVRVPYLDHELVDLALSLPDSAKLTNFKNATAHSTYRETGAKRILIDAARAFLPKDFDLQPKRGFAMPFDAWLRGEMNEIFRDTLSDTRLKQRGLLRIDQATAIRDRFLQGQLDWPQPWLLMMLELWCQEVLEQ